MATLYKKGCQFNLNKTKINYSFLFRNTLNSKKLSNKAYFMPYKVEKIATIVSINTISQIHAEWHQTLVHALTKIILKVECTRIFIGLNIKEDKQNILRYELCII